MPEKFRNRFRIKSARAPWWDYGTDAAYFITISTKGRQHYFGMIAEGKMHLSSVGIIADLLWHEIRNHFKNCQLGQFIVMPDHIHGILILNKNASRWSSSEKNGMGNDHGTNHPNVDDPLVDKPNVGGPLVDHPNVDDPTVHDPLVDNPNSKKSSPSQSRFQNQGKNTISSIVGSYKSAVSKHAHRLGLEFAWQSRFHDHIIRDADEFERISDYIRKNVKNWKDIISTN